eukprot:CAMPEP_0170539874 /NCGR_PEP_ID=MMETSP0209-20121228/104272_1 /TAXON_ID=665100 ORGANISM="Litonotus pictus, Strain P1" /NCGR_SAMPLE_ID=MMETSP0209 /ASSEMBLY_ACC=CAM_ASM_000301 /LENGTH=661 /DNA_ID=CAMNT_0010842055 /DNA_START=681 /DNA_END=2663 /DNA_ORIENTATION=-
MELERNLLERDNIIENLVINPLFIDRSLPEQIVWDASVPNQVGSNKIVSSQQRKLDTKQPNQISQVGVTNNIRTLSPPSIYIPSGEKASEESTILIHMRLQFNKLQNELKEKMELLKNAERTYVNRELFEEEISRYKVLLEEEKKNSATKERLYSENDSALRSKYESLFALNQNLVNSVEEMKKKFSSQSAGKSKLHKVNKERESEEHEEENNSNIKKVLKLINDPENLYRLQNIRKMDYMVRSKEIKEIELEIKSIYQNRLLRIEGLCTEKKELEYLMKAQTTDNINNELKIENNSKSEEEDYYDVDEVIVETEKIAVFEPNNKVEDERNEEHEKDSKERKEEILENDQAANVEGDKEVINPMNDINQNKNIMNNNAKNSELFNENNTMEQKEGETKEPFIYSKDNRKWTPNNSLRKISKSKFIKETPHHENKAIIIDQQDLDFESTWTLDRKAFNDVYYYLSLLFSPLLTDENLVLFKIVNYFNPQVLSSGKEKIEQGYIDYLYFKAHESLIFDSIEEYTEKTKEEYAEGKKSIILDFLFSKLSENELVYLVTCMNQSQVSEECLDKNEVTEQNSIKDFYASRNEGLKMQRKSNEEKNKDKVTLEEMVLYFDSLKTNFHLVDKKPLVIIMAKRINALINFSQDDKLLMNLFINTSVLNW